MKLSEKQRKILEENFYDIGISKYANGNYVYLEQWTNGGVDMYIEFEEEKDIIKALEDYLDSFDIDEEIELYREDKDYREHFTIRESVKDFENWVEFVQNVINELKEVK